MGCGSSVQSQEPQPKQIRYSLLKLCNNSIPTFFIDQNDKRNDDRKDKRNEKQSLHGENVETTCDNQLVYQLDQVNQFKSNNLIAQKERNRKKRINQQEFFDFLKDAVKENFRIINIQKSPDQIAFLKESLNKHPIFNGLSQTVHEQLINKMQFGQIQNGDIVFKQGEQPSNCFFIWSGQVEIWVKNQKVNELTKGQSFGDAALQFEAPRNATIQAISDCEVLVIDRRTFKQLVQSIQEREFKENLDYITNSNLFKNLNQHQRESVAHQLITMRFQQGDYIVHQDEDANSYYIIKKGQVKIIKDGEVVNQLKENDQFGEQALYEKAVRLASVVCSSEVVVLSLSRQDLIKVLGSRVQDAVLQNTVRWAFSSSEIMKEYTPIQTELMVQKIRYCNYRKGVTLQGPGKLDSLMIVLEGELQVDKKYKKGQLFGDIYLTEKYKDQQYLYDIIMLQDGIIGKIAMSDILKISGDDYESTVKKNRKSLKFVHEKTRIMESFNKLSLQELIFIQDLGGGGFGQVYLVGNKLDKRLGALKILEKGFIVEQNLELQIKQEVVARKQLYHPFIATFYQTFKDENRVYIFQEYISGQSFFDFIRNHGVLDKPQANFYIAQLILGIEHVHKKGIIYRDLKPENIIMGTDGYLKIIDMDSAKQMNLTKGHYDRTYTIIGTPHYMAPEILQGKGYNFFVDLWSLGVVAYELLCGYLPFGDLTDDPFEIYDEIIDQEHVQFPEYVTSYKVRDFVSQLFEKTPYQRLGGSFAVLQSNPFFRKVDWDMILGKQVEPPFLPDITIDEKQIEEQRKKGKSILDYISKNHIKMKIPKSQHKDWDEQF